jgi:hypothetical protein
VREKTQAELEIGKRFSERVAHFKACYALRYRIEAIPSVCNNLSFGLNTAIEELIASLSPGFDADAIIADLEAHL